MTDEEWLSSMFWFEIFISEDAKIERQVNRR